MSTRIIILKDLLDSKDRKERELKYYRDRLKLLVHRVALLQGDIDLTKEIIRIIEQEKVIEVEK